MVTGMLVPVTTPVDIVVVPTTSVAVGVFAVVKDTEPEQEVPSFGTVQPTVAVSEPVGAAGGVGGVGVVLPPPPQAARRRVAAARATSDREKFVFMGFSFRKRKKMVEKEKGGGTWGGESVRRRRRRTFSPASRTLPHSILILSLFVKGSLFSICFKAFLQVPLPIYASPLFYV
jgi:hypothetical protein